MKTKKIKYLYIIYLFLSEIIFSNLHNSTWAQQASLVLEDGDMVICNTVDTEWLLDKTSFDRPTASSGTITWEVTVTQSTRPSINQLTFDGFLRIYNSGSSEATIGNIVVNLQRQYGKNWVIVSSDIANATLGDDATSAFISAGASSEKRQFFFSENFASGTLEFTDLNNNTLFSLSPQKTIVPGEVMNLVYSASFNNSVLNIPVGTPIRLEVIVSFGNAGSRAGSGTTSRSVDINGNGMIDSDEAYVRSIPDRNTKIIPMLEQCNKEVMITDPPPVTTGSVTIDNMMTEIGSGVLVPRNASFTISVDYNAGSQGGEVCNTAYLDGEDTYVRIIIGYSTVTNMDNTISQVPIYHYFPCCVGVHLSKRSCLEVGSFTNAFPTNNLITYTQSEWGAVPTGNNAGTLLATYFSILYPSGVEVGLSGESGYSITFTSATAITDYLPASGTASNLTSDLTNPTSTSAGAFGGEVLALKLNVDISVANITNSDFSDLTLQGTGTSLDGLTVIQILAIAERTLGSGLTPVGYSFTDLNILIANLNEAFNEGLASSWAATHLLSRNFVTYTQNDWGSVSSGNNAGTLLATYFSTLYPRGVEVGLSGTAGFSMTFTNVTAITDYLPASGTALSLTSDLTNPTSTSAGVFGGEVLALRLNVDFSDANITRSGFSDLSLRDTGTLYDGMTVAQILAEGERLLGGGLIPDGGSIRSANEVLTFLNEVYAGGIPSTSYSWGVSNLVSTRIIVGD